MTGVAPARPKPGPPPASPALAVEALQPELTAHDRCDVGKCGARAYIRVSFTTGDLYFCGHHGRERHIQMLPTYTRWHDETSTIGDKRAGL